MKKVVIFLSLIFALFTFKVNLFACTDDKLLSVAKKIEVRLTENKDFKNLYSTIDVFNIDKNLDVVIKEDYNNTKNTYSGKDVNVASVDEENIMVNVNYTIEVYSNNGTCKGEILRTEKVTTKRYNRYSVSDFCMIEKNKNEDICDPFFDNTGIDNASFQQIVEEIKEEKKPFINKLLEVLKQNILFIIIPFVLGCSFYVILIRKEKKHKRR